MVALPKRLIEGSLLTAAVATYYTAPVLAVGPPPVPTTKTVIKKLTFTNSDTVVRLVTVYLVVKGGTPTAANILWNAKPIMAGETLICFPAEDHVLESGDMIQALADLANEVNIIASGVEIT